MVKQVVNTDRLATSANKLRTVNNTVNSEFCSLQNKAKQLDSNWKGAAGSAAQSTMYRLFQYSETRSSVLQNYINMLEQQINPGYISAENANTTLADKFK